MSHTTTIIIGSCLAVALFGGCGSGPADRPVTTSVTAGATSADTRSDVTGPERCLVPALGVSLGPGDNDMRGAHLPLRFTNTASRACTLHGAPGVSYVTGEGGEQIGLPAERDTDGPVVTLAPGETASAGLFLSSAPRKTPDCDQVAVGGLRVHPPGNTEPVFVDHEGTACAPPLDGPFLEVGPVEPGADNTGA
ncbi:DUF4232 domain-containing protein [Saccharothrix longispora]|uniref:DUF4232 domain-containing protein n=1 Tax=Saccharothrix longispora TaxID=33920 RepID=A0ABU1PUJ1_9PSEU|nr:DUF4232 domain-containing protein [Saccharothrix longispora]MDR6594289.1 hypothetical protein [Saccharothrix longispora]